MIVFPLTIVSGLLLSAGGLAPFVHPKYISWLPLLGLTFPFLFALNIIWLIYWWVQLKFKMIIPLCFIVLNLIHISKYVQYTSTRETPANAISVATYNTQLFGVFQDSNFFGNVLENVRKEKYDILCMQEFYAKKNLSERLVAIKKQGSFTTYCFYRLVPERPYGMVIFSTFPVLRSGRVGLGSNTGNMAIWADVLVNGDTVRIYNLHLQSIRFRKKDYDFINNDIPVGNSKLEGSKHLIRRLCDAYEKRAQQADSVAAHFQSCPYPRIVMGDFNDVPLSYTYNTVSRGLLDAFREAGSGFDRTYKGPFPNFRIDYILASKNFKCFNYHSESHIPGDHKLVSVKIVP